MKITLIMPGVGRKPGEPYVRGWKMQPLPLAVLAALTPRDVDVRFVDDRVEPIPYDDPTDAAAISAETYTARRAYQIAESFRARGVPVILGGYHPTLVPAEACGFADAIVIGEAETVWSRVIGDLRRQQLRAVYRSEARPVLDGLQPRREIFHDKPYLPLTLIETGRGCRFACDFCSVSCFYRQTYRPRPVEDILAEIETCGNQTVFFTDDNIVADFDRARRLFRAVRPLGINWLSQGSVNMAEDPEMLKLMRQSGCRGILVGFESLSDETLASMGKGWNRTARDYGEAVKRIRDAGIAIYATFVFGYDSDTAESIDRALEFAIRQKFFMAAFNHLVPFPGTPVYARLRRQGRLRSDRWWLSPQYRFGDVAFEPRYMTAEELSQRCHRARCDFYRCRSVMARAVDLRANCADVRAALSYFWMNLFSGREARRRQGLPLGEGLDREQRHGQICDRAG